VVLTTSDATIDLRGCTSHADAYVTESAGLDEFAGRVRDIDDLYLGLLCLPRPGEAQVTVRSTRY